MNIEQSGLARRARVHGALADPGRLAIVDLLVVGDAAPGELGAMLQMPTNLIAHHLKTLEDVGLIVRDRSEGDRRRTYVRLTPAALSAGVGLVDGSLVDAGAGAGVAANQAERVVFVCTHNSARSQLAAALWTRRSHVPAVSAGTHPATRVHPRAAKTARRHGLDPTSWRTAHIDQVAIDDDDLLIAVCDNAYEDLAASPVGAQVPQGSRRLHWSIPDPAAVDRDEAFEAVYTELTDRIDRLAAIVDINLDDRVSDARTAVHPSSPRSTP